MPAGVIRGPKSEQMWKRAKAVATQGYPGLETTNSDRFYAIVMTIYKAMCKKHGCAPADESTSLLLGRLEICEDINEYI